MPESARAALAVPVPAGGCSHELVAALSPPAQVPVPATGPEIAVVVRRVQRVPVQAAGPGDSVALRPENIGLEAWRCRYRPSNLALVSRLPSCVLWEPSRQRVAGGEATESRLASVLGESHVVRSRGD